MSVLPSVADKPDKSSQNITRRIVELIDKLMQHEDFEVKRVAKVSFIEPLLHKLAEKIGCKTQSYTYLFIS